MIVAAQMLRNSLTSWTLDLQQHVKQPSHSDGHTLDLSITRKSETLVEDELMINLHVFISDHAVVLTRLRLS